MFGIVKKDQNKILLAINQYQDNKKYLYLRHLINKMSVKYQKKTHTRSSSKTMEGLNGTDVEVLVCSPTSIKFTKANICHLLLQCQCEPPSVKQINQLQSGVKSSVGYEISNEAYTVELDGSNSLNVIKNHVKHIFPLEGEGSSEKEWVKIIFQRDHKITVNTYGIIKTDRKIKLVKDAGSYAVDDRECFTVRPLELLSEKIKQRALKMSKSQKKQISFSQSKKFNILGSQKSPVNVASTGLTSSFSSVLQGRQAQLKRSIKKANISLALCDRTNFDVRGVEYRRSVEKDNQNGKSPANKRCKENFAATRASKYQSVWNSKVDRKPKNSYETNSKVSRQSQNNSKGLTKSQRLKEDDISSMSYYTSKKSVSSVFQFTQHQPILEVNLKSQQKSFSNLMVKNPKTQTKNSSKVTPSNKGFNLSTNPKSFNKNISQSKIMQVSRTLLIDKNSK